MARLESTKRAKLKTAKQHQSSQKYKSLTCCHLLPRFWVTRYLVPIGTVDLKKKSFHHKLFRSFPNKGGCSYNYPKLTLPKPDFMTATLQIWYQCNEGPKLGAPWLSTTASGATPWPNTEDLSWLPLGKGDKNECFWQKIVNIVNENTFGYQTWWWQPSIHLDLN